MEGEGWVYLIPRLALFVTGNVVRTKLRLPWSRTDTNLSYNTSFLFSFFYILVRLLCLCTLSDYYDVSVFSLEREKALCDSWASHRAGRTEYEVM